MSLAQKINVRNQSDLLNEGYQYTVNGVQAGAIDLIVVPIASERAPIVTGFLLSTDSSNSALVSLGFKKGTEATLVFAETYVSKYAPIQVQYNENIWKRGGLGYNVVISITGGTVCYTVDSKITSFAAEVGYIEHEGVQNASGHGGRAHFPQESGKDRGQMEI